jgi:hypothetical protein
MQCTVTIQHIYFGIIVNVRDIRGNCGGQRGVVRIEG